MPTWTIYELLRGWINKPLCTASLTNKEANALLMTIPLKSGVAASLVGSKTWGKVWELPKLVAEHVSGNTGGRHERNDH